MREQWVDDILVGVVESNMLLEFDFWRYGLRADLCHFWWDVYKSSPRSLLIKTGVLAYTRSHFFLSTPNFSSLPLTSI